MESNERVLVTVTAGLHPTSCQLPPSALVRVGGEALSPPPIPSLKLGMEFRAARLRPESVMKGGEGEIILGARYFPEKGADVGGRGKGSGVAVTARRQESSWEWGSSVQESPFPGKTQIFRYSPS